MKRQSDDIGRLEGVYDGTRRTGQVTRTREGYFAQDIAGKWLGTCSTHGEATKLVFDTDKAAREARR